MTRKYTVLDLFSGAGGLTEGFIRAGFNIIGHIEKDKSAAETLQTRVLYHKLKDSGKLGIYYQYMQNFGKENARKIFIEKCEGIGLQTNCVINEEISNETRDNIISRIRSLHGKKHVDVVIGGPPCQAYSMLRRWDQIKHDYTDGKGFLYLQYLYFLEQFSPRIFVFENVPGLNSMAHGERFAAIKEGFKNIGYEIGVRELNATSFGVLQERKRIIIIGWDAREKHDYPEFIDKKSPYTITDLLLNDLPKLQAGEGKQIQEYATKRPSKVLIESGIRDENQKILLHHVARPHIDRDREIYRCAIKAWTKNHVRLKYNTLDDSLQTHANKTAFLDRYKVVNPFGYSHSVVSHLSKDGHYFIHPDITQARSITVREAARIQSFPDDYIFEGSRTSQFTQIGNAVPPLMAEGIAQEIKKMLGNN